MIKCVIMCNNNHLLPPQCSPTDVATPRPTAKQLSCWWVMSRLHCAQVQILQLMQRQWPWLGPCPPRSFHHLLAWRGACMIRPNSRVSYCQSSSLKPSSFLSLIHAVQAMKNIALCIMTSMYLGWCFPQDAQSPTAGCMSWMCKGLSPTDWRLIQAPSRLACVKSGLPRHCSWSGCPISWFQTPSAP